MTLQLRVLIPAYDPAEGLMDLAADILVAGLSILVVDDGSDIAAQPLFDRLAMLEGVDVIHHEANKGKGAALKSGFRWLAEQGYTHAITADADGQHLSDDIVAVAHAVGDHPESLVLGVRDIASMPGRSKFGNSVTRLLVRAVADVDVADTQTGLRGVPLGDVAKLCALGGDSYEFEMAMLVKGKGLFDGIVEVPIATVYEPGNASSHFRPIRDGLRVASVLLRILPNYLVISLSSFAIDYALFALFSLIAGFSVVASVISARVVSATFNYLCNRRFVFRVSGREYTPLRYFVLAACILGANTLLVWFLADFLGIPGLIAKVLVEILLYSVSFLVQSHLAARDVPSKRGR